MSQTKAEQVILGLGDSLMAGYGLNAGEAFPDQLQEWLDAQDMNVTVLNAGVSGDTSSGGRSRLDWSLMDAPGGKPDLVIVELGANDALRVIDPSITRDNLIFIIETLQARGIPVLLAGMQAPPNVGSDYAAEFNGIYPELAETYDLAFYPFFLDGVAADPSLNLPDGIHPTAEGIGIIVERIGPLIKDTLGSLSAE